MEKYVLRKLWESMDTLTCHKGDARERIKAAYNSFHVLKPDDFELPEHKAEWASILNEITKFGAVLNPDTQEVWEGALIHTMRRIRKSTGANLIKRISDLYWEVSSNNKYL